MKESVIHIRSRYYGDGVYVANVPGWKTLCLAQSSSGFEPAAVACQAKLLPGDTSATLRPATLAETRTLNERHPDIRSRSIETRWFVAVPTRRPVGKPRATAEKVA